MLPLSCRLAADSKVWLGSLHGDETFQNFIDGEVTDILRYLAAEQLDFSFLIELQYHFAKRWSQIVVSDQNTNIALSLASCRDPGLFLLVWDSTEAVYCQQPNQLSKTEYEQMSRSQLTVGELLERNPTAFLGPLMPHQKFRF